MFKGCGFSVYDIVNFVMEDVFHVLVSTCSHFRKRAMRLHCMPQLPNFCLRKRHVSVNLSKSSSAKIEAICLPFLKAEWVLMME